MVIPLLSTAVLLSCSRNLPAGNMMATLTASAPDGTPVHSRPPPEERGAAGAEPRAPSSGPRGPLRGGHRLLLASEGGGAVA
ncbi:unnamed protein product, partial [Ectocarpus fasciculatus]